MEFDVVTTPGDGVTLRLDYRAFAYAGKFVIGATGKAALFTGDGSPAAPEWTPTESLPAGVDRNAFERDVLAAVSFSPDRTDPACCRLRYVTVHAARRGEGLGPAVIARTVDRLAATGYDRVRIAVNNPFAYEAVYKCGFAYAGETTGIAELELTRKAARPADRDDEAERYRSGLSRFRDRDGELSEAERRFLDDRLGGDAASDDGEGDRPSGPPDVIDHA